MKLKVCGMAYEDNIKAVAALQPEYLGFIFHEPSSRHFQGSIPTLPKGIKKVGVFVDESIAFITAQIEKHGLTAIQLHGHESPETCRILKSTDAEIIKVFSIKDRFDFSVLEPYEAVCDYFLFDTKGRLPGGNGYAFDWNVLKEYPSKKSYFLSGGIGLEQIEDLKAFLNSDASKHCKVVDVNSKFEIEPGLKNVELLKEFKKHVTSSDF